MGNMMTLLPLKFCAKKAAFPGWCVYSFSASIDVSSWRLPVHQIFSTNFEVFQHLRMCPICYLKCVDNLIPSFYIFLTYKKCRHHTISHHLSMTIIFLRGTCHRSWNCWLAWQMELLPLTLLSFCRWTREESAQTQRRGLWRSMELESYFMWFWFQEDCLVS